MPSLKKIRNDFPILSTGIIYLDNAATSLTPRQVIERMAEYYCGYRANVGRGIYRLAQKTTEGYEEARKTLARFIGARRSEEIVFTKNTTEGINLVAHGLKFRKGENIVSTLLEHHSNLLPWMRCRDRWGVELRLAKPSREGFLELSDFERLIDSRTRLVAISHVSNVLGVIVPVREICEIAHERGALVLVDGAQSTPHMKIDVSKLDCDFYAFSGHKMCGPTGSGALYVKLEAQGELEPPFLGGGTVSHVTLEGFRLLEGPQRFEGGTPLIAEAIGLKAAAEYLEGVGMGWVEAHERKLSERIYEGLMELERVEVYGPEPRFKLGVTSFNVVGVNPHKVAESLDSRAGIAVRSGMHCAQPLVEQVLGQPQGTVRVSPYLYNTEEEVEKFLRAVEEVARNG